MRQRDMDKEAPTFIRLFGVPAIEVRSLRTPLGVERPHQLLAYLACRRNWVRRDELADLLWPQHPPGAARSNLRKVLLLAARIPGAVGIERHDDMVRWLPDSDLERFEKACDEGRMADAIECYLPPLLSGMEAAFEDGQSGWLAAERARVQARWRGACAARLAQLSDQPAALAELAQQMLIRDPLDETAASVLARAQLALGLNGFAAQTVAAYRQRLGDSVDAEATTALGQLEQQGQLAPVFEPSRSKLASTGLIGRRVELAAIQEMLLDPEVRCLVLMGPGGIGKTTTSRVAAATFAERSGQRVVWIPLDDLSEASQLPTRLAGRLGLTLVGRSDGWSQIEAHLERSRLLLIFDSAEHLILGDVLARLLGACAEVRTLVTSRARLGVPGERTLVFEGLPLPDDDERDPEVLRRCDAVRLFEARALAASPAFDLTRQAEHVVNLLYLVEGLPLAIELAAAWMRVIPAAAVVKEMQGSVDWIDARAPVVGRALRASFEQSWRLLDGPGRAILARLATLPGDFGREMAEDVAGATLSALASLIDQSLLHGEGDGRFSQHALIRQCAAQRVDDLEAVMARHSAFVARWLSPHGRAGAAVPAALLDRIGEELPHVRAAWAHAVAHRDAHAIVAMGPAVSAYVKERGLFAEGIEAFQDAVRAFERADAAAQPPQHAVLSMLLRALSGLQYHVGDVRSAQHSARRLLALADEAADAWLAMAALNILGACLLQHSQYAEARPLFERARHLAEQAGIDKSAAIYSTNLAGVDGALGDYESARTGYEHALVLHRRAGLLQGVAGTQCDLATVLRALRRPEEALRVLCEALVVCKQHGLVHVQASVMMNLGATHLELGDHEASALWLGRAWEESSRQAAAMLRLGTRLAQVHLDCAIGACDAARVKAWEAVAIAEEIEMKAVQLECVDAFGTIVVAEGRVAEGHRAICWALEQDGWNRIDRDAAERRLTRIENLNGFRRQPLRPIPTDMALSQVLAMLA
ncbi:MAG: tetratricopeptide repeat protein [Chitinophagaceae bacterium]|nr:tetratricopeptide repeat protein [Rubrivivax sp.]